MIIHINYDKKADILFIRFGAENRPAVSVDCDGELWCRVDPRTKEIVGIEIEDFHSVFCPKHIGLAMWQ